MPQLLMNPPPGERLVRFVGDRVRFELRPGQGGRFPEGWRAFLRTNLGRAAVVREEIVRAYFHQVPLAGASWRDIPMQPAGNGAWTLDLPLTEIGWFKAKAYARDAEGFQHWPDGPDFGVNVQPDFCRTANTIYCAFVRTFGPSKTAHSTDDAQLAAVIKELDGRGYTVIPPSGTFRDLRKELPHIIGTLGCRIVHLLPVNPTPTTYARFGRFGSPYAIQDLTAVDPALVEFDKKTTGVDQFCELADDIHGRGAKLFLDVVINHTGWGSTLQEQHPEWFLRKPDGEFESPGAWGNTWADLVELEHQHPQLWETIAQAFLTWCRRGVDGFRCDAGYKVPVIAWQYIIARVRQEFPRAVFLLEGLGGGWWDTENLLTEGGMQWAYSELFQEYSAHQVSRYLGHALKQSGRVGVLVHYSETHDNLRLAAKGRDWSLHRNRLCALTSVSGGFGFTCGVEWLAPERVNVHSSRGLAWGAKDNIVKELADLNRLVTDHPCFFDNAKLTRLSDPDSPIYALRRDSAEGLDSVLVLANPDEKEECSATIPLPAGWDFTAKVDLLGQSLPKLERSGQKLRVTLPSLACVCLAAEPKPRGLSGDVYRKARAQSAWAMSALSQCLAAEDIGPADWRELGALAAGDPGSFLSACQRLTPEESRTELLAALKRRMGEPAYARVVRWNRADARRVTLVPVGHWLLIEDDQRFQAVLATPGPAHARHADSIQADGSWIAALRVTMPGDADLELRLVGATKEIVGARLRGVGGTVAVEAADVPAGTGLDAPLALLTNARGGMARVCVDLGTVKSKYDCVLGANLHGHLPVDRHVFAKRVRLWCDADGFISPLDQTCLRRFVAGTEAVWHFEPNAGDGRSVGVEVRLAMQPGANTTLMLVRRLATDRDVSPDRSVRLTVRVDIEDRNFHWETKRNGGSEHHFAGNSRALAEQVGFEFTPAADRQLRVVADRGRYHSAPEWSDNLPHIVEQSRGQEGAGDAWSPGWFEIPLEPDGEATLVLTAEQDWQAALEAVKDRGRPRPQQSPAPDGQPELASLPNSVAAADEDVRDPSESDPFAATLRRACEAYVVRRDDGKTVIAGYPWFLDWGRDTLIAARGLLAAGMVDEVRQMLVTFGRFEENGTLPNTIHGANASNRDTSDAPLWYGVVCEELAAVEIPKSEIRSLKETRNPKSEIKRSVSDLENSGFFRASGSEVRICSQPVDDDGRTIADVLRSIAVHHLRGTPNGIRVDEASGLVWSPSHFTWMDTNHPAGTPREGYPVEIQVLWIRLLRQLERLGVKADKEPWAKLAERAEKSFHTFFWLEDVGWFADVLLAKAGEPARTAMPDTALRSNMLFAISLGLVTGERAQRCVEAAARHLVVPGALRSLAPLAVSPPLPIHAADGRLLNDPLHPYWGRYEGDEDTRRKPAYHNGTAWVWTFPTFCEALALAWAGAPEAVAAARAYLGSTDRLLAEGCVGQLPEIVDGDAPHPQRGCDAQAWSVTETLRVWEWLKALGTPPPIRQLASHR
jgi:starch synthase (maltosyl-transferring)